MLYILRRWIIPMGTLFGFIFFIGCRGSLSTKPPIHLNPNMDNQSRFDTQERNPFFKDNRSVRPFVRGTIPRGFLRGDDHLYRGKIKGKYVKRLPMKQLGLTQKKMGLFLRRGQARYDIFCAPCHGYKGDGKGIITNFTKAMNPADLHDVLRRTFSVGRIYEVMIKGKMSEKTIAMPSFAERISVKDRWAIVAYIRALQLAKIPLSILKKSIKKINKQGIKR